MTTVLRDDEIKPDSKLHSTHTLYTESVYNSNNLTTRPIGVFLLKPAINTLANVRKSAVQQMAPPETQTELTENPRCLAFTDTGLHL